MAQHTGVVDHDPVTGISKLFHRLHDGDWAYETLQDVSSVLDANKEAQNHVNPNSPDGSMRRVASIPMIFAQKWLDDYGINIYKREHWDAVRKKLNDPEWRWLRTDNSVL